MPREAGVPGTRAFRVLGWDAGVPGTRAFGVLGWDAERLDGKSYVSLFKWRKPSVW